MNPLPVPVNPQSLATMQARYAAALDYVYEQAAIANGGIRPGEVAANVFDWEDGLRLVVSRARYAGGELFLHFSASFPEQCRMADEFRLLLPFLQSRERLLAKWREEVLRRFAALSGDTRQPRYLGASDKHIPHWIIEEAT